MNTKIFALIAAAALSAPLATNAMAHDDAGYGRGRGGWERREEVYTVRYHIDGDVRRHADGHRDAHRLVDYLESLGADAHIDGDHDVHYHMHGSRGRSFYSHGQAHEFADRLRGLGFHVAIDH